MRGATPQFPLRHQLHTRVNLRIPNFFSPCVQVMSCLIRCDKKKKVVVTLLQRFILKKNSVA
jgi:hypothetical protein